jgi:LPS O-antigen subunit length determinant protein (WzzB/FepE family)
VPILIVLWKFKYWIAIAVLSFICIGQLAYTNHLSGKLQEAETKCTAKIQEIEQKQLKALAEKQNGINQVSADYEQIKSAQRRQVETVTREVQKIVEHPIYLNNCFDDSGLQQLNSLINSDSSELNRTGFVGDSLFKLGGLI